MITLTTAYQGVLRKHKFFHFEYLVLIDLLDVRYGDFTMIDRKMIARELCFLGVVNYGGIEFKLEDL